MIHNLIEEIVFAEVEKACADIVKKTDGHDDICTCPQCRLDAACYVLNRVKPQYIVSSRGLLREEQLDLEKQQKLADITGLVYEGIKQVGKNRRPGFDHANYCKPVDAAASAYFNIPVIIGRVFNGGTFEPVSGIDMELYMDGKLAVMKDANWQNPCKLIKKTKGTFTFWPESMAANKAGEQRVFNFLIKTPHIEHSPIVYHFELPVVSEKDLINAVAMNRTHKISDLYIFDMIDVITTGED